MPTAQEITHSTELSQGGVNGVSGQPRLAEIYLDEISQWLMLLSPFIWILQKTFAGVLLLEEVAALTSPAGF